MRGKTPPPRPHVLHEAVASMRPPQNAGENVLEVADDHLVALASMRPPQNAGENTDEIWRLLS